MSRKLPVNIFARHGIAGLPSGKIREISLCIYSGERIAPQRCTNLVCCSDYVIRRLNREYRNIDKVTDVLSFPFDDPDFLGEIYISLRRTGVQARRLGHSFNDEFLRLFVHGMLHLAGFDHATAGDEVRMHRKENHYLQKNIY